MTQAKTPGIWATKSTEQLTINLALADVWAACRGAGAEEKGWRIAESDANRILATNGPGIIDFRPYHVEVLLTDATGGGTTVNLNGWTFGKGPGLNKMVRRAVSEFRAAVEVRASH